MTTLLLAALAAASATTGAITPENDAVHRRRAAELVAKMTLEEKVSQMLSDAVAVPRLDIPSYNWWNEALHGVARAGLATVFPQGIGRGASFDVETEREVGDVIGTEGRAKYNLFQKRGLHDWYCGLTFWSPTVNMFRDPRWGRGQETFGEDPFLAGRMGSAFVRGLQGDDPKYLKAAACAKHYCVHSGPEHGRRGFNSVITERELREYYLPAFEALVKEGRVEAVMTAYNAVNGTPCSASRYLLDGILRDEWGFGGHVVSDMSAVEGVMDGHGFTKTPVETAVAAHSSGLDLCGGHIATNLVRAVREGKYPEKKLDECLVHLFTARMRLGMFEKNRPWADLGAKDVANAAHRAVAVKAAEKSLVLVKNNGVLPLDRRRIRQIGVGGPLALDEIALYGSYNGFSGRPSSLLSGMVEVAGPAMQICHVKGCDMVGGPAVSAGAIGFAFANTEVIVVGVGITAELEGEDDSTVVGAGGGDRKSIGLPGRQMEFLKIAKSFGRSVVAVVFGGSSLDLAPVMELADAVLLAFYPGEGGGTAIARTIFGLANPAGRLPITYPKSLGDLPPQTDYHTAGHTYRYSLKEPLLPFGFGLSYTDFAYENLDVKRTAAGWKASVDVRNTGKYDGEEVVQIYVRGPAGSDARRHHLEGFKRVFIRKGFSSRVEIDLPVEALMVYGEDGKRFAPAGETTVFAGGGQPGFGATLSVKVDARAAAPEPEPPPPQAVPAVDFRKPPIVPEPKRMTYRADKPVRILNTTVFEVEAPSAAAAKWVAAKAKAWFGVGVEVKFSPVEEFVPDKPLDPESEAYRLKAEPGRISISAKTLKGVKYAMHTLRQAAERESTGFRLKNYWLPALEIEDRPALAFRGVHFCWMPEMSATLIEHQIRAAAYCKFNFAVIENWGVFKGDRNPDFCVPDAPLTVAEARRLTAIASDLGLTLIPQINMFGHASFERGCAAKHSTLDYRPGMQPIFEPAGGWNWCLSNPAARLALRDLAAELHEAFGNPPFFHIGCDEAAPPSCPTCRAVKPYSKLVRLHITEVADMLRKRGARAMMWHDMLLEKGGRWAPFYANGDADEAKMIDELPKDIVICDWYYGTDGGGCDPTGGKVETGAYPTLEYFRSKGFDVLTCPWRLEKGIVAQGAYARRHGMFGMLQTVWHHYRGTEFQRMMESASHSAWGDGGRLVEPWMQPAPFHTFWRQVGWDMGIKDHDETGFFGKQVSRDNPFD
ncbi:MAG: glycoside hydrolase family 3 C-terminal domain-containing protein [Kiritimatiellae bacterium]|nr:glycoside hydrolase family 3 C-terminal domain-containing protein [Kiritimatiellia bacterium]